MSDFTDKVYPRLLTLVNDARSIPKDRNEQSRCESFTRLAAADADNAHVAILEATVAALAAQHTDVVKLAKTTHDKEVARLLDEQTRLNTAYKEGLAKNRTEYEDAVKRDSASYEKSMKSDRDAHDQVLKTAQDNFAKERATMPTFVEITRRVLDGELSAFMVNRDSNNIVTTYTRAFGPALLFTTHTHGCGGAQSYAIATDPAHYTLEVAGDLGKLFAGVPRREDLNQHYLVKLSPARFAQLYNAAADFMPGKLRCKYIIPNPVVPKEGDRSFLCMKLPGL